MKVNTAQQSSRISPAGLARALGIHYSWVVVGAAFVLLIASAGVRSAPGILIKPLEKDFGWSRGDISWALAVSLVTLGLAAPVSGWAYGRFGMRRTSIAFLILGTAGVALTAAIQNILHLYLAWGSSLLSQ